MLLFYKHIVYTRLYHVISRNVILQIDRGNKRYFTGFNSMNNFIYWYSTVPIKDKTLNEVIVSDMRKFVIDIDNPEDPKLIKMLMFYDIKKHVTSRIKYVLQNFNITPEILVYNMSTDNYISYHFIVSNIAFNRKTCYGLCELICKGQIWESLVDKCVYKRIQTMRIEGSTKYGQNRHKAFININQSFLSNIFSVQHSKLDIKITENRERINKADSLLVYKDIANNFKVRKIQNNSLLLNRTKPAYCVQCKRVHTRENAIILNINSSHPIFICWRRYYS